jgi:hypothetical protein
MLKRLIKFKKNEKMHYSLIFCTMTGTKQNKKFCHPLGGNCRSIPLPSKKLYKIYIVNVFFIFDGKNFLAQN